MMQKLRSRGWCMILISSLIVPFAGCGAGSENDREFLKEAGVGKAIENFDQGYASRKEKRQAELDAMPKSKKKGRG